jgi:hypothetical protein
MGAPAPSREQAKVRPGAGSQSRGENYDSVLQAFFILYGFSLFIITKSSSD